MVWSRTILDDLVVCLIFNVTVALLWMMIPGTEHCAAWNLKPWMLTLALPEHCIGWPIIVCPMTGLICAGIGTLIR